MVRELMNDNKTVAAAMRKAHELCDDHEDVATASLLENVHRRDREADLVPVRIRARGGRVGPLTRFLCVARVNDVSGEGGLLPSPAS